MNKTFIYLIALVPLLLTGFGASAQSGATPYLNSTHTYTSAKSTLLTGTTLAWSLSEGGTLTESGGTNNFSATVLWTAIGVHTVTVTETTADGCSTRRDFPVTVTSNLFDLTITAPGIACAAGSGTVIANGALSPGNTTVVFTVAVAGNTTKTSKFDYALTTGTTAVISSVTIDNIYSGASLTGDDLTIPASVNSFTVSVVVASRFDTVDDLTLTISDGRDFYGTPENDTSDNAGTATINAVPNTSSITTD